MHTSGTILPFFKKYFNRSRNFNFVSNKFIYDNQTLHKLVFLIRKILSRTQEKQNWSKTLNTNHALVNMIIINSFIATSHNTRIHIQTPFT